MKVQIGYGPDEIYGTVEAVDGKLWYTGQADVLHRLIESMPQSRSQDAETLLAALPKRLTGRLWAKMNTKTSSEEGDEAGEESIEDDEEDSTTCQGPFWPSPDDANTGYCTCCKQVYHGDLLSHPCMTASKSDNAPQEEEGQQEQASTKGQEVTQELPEQVTSPNLQKFDERLVCLGWGKWTPTPGVTDEGKEFYITLEDQHFHIMSVDEAMSLSDDELLARIEQVVGMSIEEVHELYGVKEEEQSE